MAHYTRQTRARLLLGGIVLSLLSGVGMAQQGPMAAMFRNDEKRYQSQAASFVHVELPATATSSAPLHVFLSTGDLGRAFDEAQFRPDGAIVPTNTALTITAPSPATQRVLIDRVQKHPDIMRHLQDQIAARRAQAPPDAGKEGELLQIGVDTFVATLSGPTQQPAQGAFPRIACLVATDDSKGGAIDRRGLFTQDRVRKGIAGCLAALDSMGAGSVAMPLMGAASSSTQTKDPLYEGQRLLKECRLLNSVAGIALGVHDFASARRNVREIGIVQWDQEIEGMFSVPQGDRAAASARAAYRVYAEQVQLALRKGLAGENTTPSDVSGSCNATFNAQ